MGLSRSEQETIISRAADQKHWHIFSEDPSVIRKLTKLHGPGKPVGEGAEWEVPKRSVSFRSPVKMASGRASNFKRTQTTNQVA